MMVYLGYGFVQPRAGQWIVTLQPTADTPRLGLITPSPRNFTAVPRCKRRWNQLLPAVNQPVTVQAQLTTAGQPVSPPKASVRQPNGQLTTYPLVMAGATATLTLAPAWCFYGVEVSVRTPSRRMG